MHIGTARTAYFNWLYARGRAGRFMLRIEDTDRARSTPEATQAILRGLSWLGLDWDGEATSQFARMDRHAEVAHELLDAGKAYKCFSTQEEIAAYRERAHTEKRSTLFRSPWRDADPATHPDAPFAIRVKAPRNGVTTVQDMVQGNVTVRNSELDDMVCLRSDGTPTYMLAVVVDDHDMGVTHVIRGDDHLSNAARQTLVYNAMGWDVPVWAHLPLIHGPDGRKLSKRHGATAVEDYQAMGIPASAMRNCLARLGWSHGDDEFFTDRQAIEWFDLGKISRAPARFDMKKLRNLAGRHIAAADDAALLAETEAYLAASGQERLDRRQRDGLFRAMHCLKERAKSFPDLLEKAHFVLGQRPFKPGAQAAGALDGAFCGILSELTRKLQNASWDRDTLEQVVAKAAEAGSARPGKVMQTLRAALSGRAVSPGVFDMMLVIGREETLLRLGDATGT